jgi:ABC-type antimicrobial peptide transport system permease subunit
VAAARAQLAARRDRLDILSAGTMSEALADSITQRRFAAWAYGGFAVCALAITAVGTLGLVAMITSLRTREIAVRLALGAPGGTVIRLLLREQITAVVIGLAGGGLFAAWSIGALRSKMFGVTTSDPRIWTATALIILATALLGTVIPALRAAAIDPIRALRTE